MEREASLISRRTLVAGGSAIAAGTILSSAWLPIRHLASAATPSPVVRQDIFTFQQDAQRVSVLEAAIGEMQARSLKDPSDPKGWLVNAKAHADFCSVPQIGDPDQIHFCWWFLPWHRAFIALTERKLRDLSGDSTIAFPYWNWSADRRIPKVFAKVGSSLANAVRYTPDRDIRDSEVDYFPADPVKAKLGVAALGVDHFTATGAPDIGNSFGGVSRPNADNRYGNNRLEGVPHGPIHNYVGGEDSNTNAAGDMADFETAARDPIFFAHHANLDRLWERWRLDTKRKATEPITNNFLDHQFPFTWLDGSIVTISARETLDTHLLGYTYDTLDVFRPTAVAAQVNKVAENNLPPVARETVAVPLTAFQAGPTPTKYALVITGIKAPERPMTVGVFVKSASDQNAGPGLSIGSFAAVRSGGRIEFPDTTLEFDISDAINQLRSGSLLVTLIPFSLGSETKFPYGPLKYGSMRIVPAQAR